MVLVTFLFPRQKTTAKGADKTDILLYLFGGLWFYRMLVHDHQTVLGMGSISLCGPLIQSDIDWLVLQFP